MRQEREEITFQILPTPVTAKYQPSSQLIHSFPKYFTTVYKPKSVNDPIYEYDLLIEQLVDWERSAYDRKNPCILKGHAFNALRLLVIFVTL
jgi:hypothetical protein